MTDNNQATNRVKIKFTTNPVQFGCNVINAISTRFKSSGLRIRFPEKAAIKISYDNILNVQITTLDKREQNMTFLVCDLTPDAVAQVKSNFEPPLEQGKPRTMSTHVNNFYVIDFSCLKLRFNPETTADWTACLLKLEIHFGDGLEICDTLTFRQIKRKP